MSSPASLDDGVVLWSADAADRAGRPLLVLLHGYGADERDLFALVPYLPPRFVVAAVRAPLAPPFPAPGYSWYAIDGPDSRDPGHVTAAAHRLIAWTDAAAGPARTASAHSAPGMRAVGGTTVHPAVGLLGFSQGGAVAVQAMRIDPHRFAFAVNLSGYATPGDLPRDAELADLRPPVFWGRGTHDDVIPPFLVEHTTQWLPAHTDLSGRVYPGLTHSISEQELADVGVFLAKRLAELDPGAD